MAAKHFQLSHRCFCGGERRSLVESAWLTETRSSTPAKQLRRMAREDALVFFLDILTAR
ncbi:unnamed protein product [Sphenostylis stenocarpa]|uniref:Uncharacterized protein n=1 Tax=Sphenostylis stenocarpa TaxID=92480 RepID=A0AA86RX75_9FABA|nr:unnamed protein product [Sphenostylis stenocarpa]